MRKKVSYVFLLCIVFCVVLFSNTVVYGEEVVVESNFIYDSIDDCIAITDIIIDEINRVEKSNTLKIIMSVDVDKLYPTLYETNTTEEVRVVLKKDMTDLTHNIIERLDGVLPITPSVNVGLSISYKTVRVFFYIRPYNGDSEGYLEKMNSLIENGKQQKNDYEKIHYLGNYFYKNGFEYAYDNNDEFRSSRVIENQNYMPDGVLSRKKAICMGFANVASEYLTGLGFKNVKVRGYSVEDGGYHVWNMVYMTINGVADWYCVDYGCSIYREYNKRLIRTREQYNEYTWDSILEEDILKLKYNNLEVKGLYNIFKDIKNHWAEKDILSAYENNFISGYMDKTFKPNNDISIIEFLQIAVAAYVPAENRVNVEYWWDGVYNYALDKGIINEELFSIDIIFDTITREQMAYILVNIDDLFNTKVLSNKEVNLNIPDDDLISEEYKPQVYKAYSRGYIKGVNNEGVFNPSAFATRAQAVVILCRMKGL